MPGEYVRPDWYAYIDAHVVILCACDRVDSVAVIAGDEREPVKVKDIVDVLPVALRLHEDVVTLYLVCGHAPEDNVGK
jgi:hypothetical protein